MCTSLKYYLESDLKGTWSSAGVGAGASFGSEVGKQISSNGYMSFSDCYTISGCRLCIPRVTASSQMKNLLVYLFYEVLMYLTLKVMLRLDLMTKVTADRLVCQSVCLTYIRLVRLTLKLLIFATFAKTRNKKILSLN